MIQYKEYPREKVTLLQAIGILMANPATPVLSAIAWRNLPMTVRAWEDCA